MVYDTYNISTRKTEITEVWAFSHCEETGVFPEVVA